jgi:hypothetical protein
VLPYEERPEMSTEVEATFSKFAQGAVRSYRREFKDWGGANHIEARIMEGVASLYPEVFADQEAFCERHAHFAAAAVIRERISARRPASSSASRINVHRTTALDRGSQPDA